MFLGNHSDNWQDARKKGRLHWQTHPENLFRGDQHWTRAKNHLVRRGERHGEAKLKESQVKRILLKNEGSAELAKELNITTSSIQKIRRGATWKHVWKKIKLLKENK